MLIMLEIAAVILAAPLGWIAGGVVVRTCGRFNDWWVSRRAVRAAEDRLVAAMVAMDAAFALTQQERLNQPRLSLVSVWTPEPSATVGQVAEAAQAIESVETLLRSRSANP